MALWALAWQGSTPIGGPVIGWIGQELGPRWSLLAGGVPTIAVGLAALPVLAALSRRTPGPAPEPFEFRSPSRSPSGPAQGGGST